MKIAFVIPYYAPFVGGIETYTFELIKELSKEHIINVFTCGRGITETYDGVTVHRLRALDVRNLPLKLGIPYPVPPSLIFELVGSGADLIHAHGHAFVTSFCAAAAARLSRKPFVITVHDLGIAYHDYRVIRGVRPIVDSTFVRFTIKQAAAVIALNEATRSHIEGFSPKRMEVIPQGIDFRKFNNENRDEGEYVTFIAARLTAQKGGETFIRSVPLVLEKEKDARFLVIGDGIQKTHLQELCGKLNIENRVNFTGRVPYDEVPEYLKQSKIVVFPSEIPTGLTLLEAAAMKKPLITTANTWALETLGEAPVFIKPKNPNDAAKAIVHLLKQPMERSRIANAAWKKVASTYSWRTVAARHTKLYKEIKAPKLESAFTQKEAIVAQVADASSL